MNAGTRFLLMTVRTEGFPRRRKFHPVFEAYVAAFAALLVGIALLLVGWMTP